LAGQFLLFLFLFLLSEEEKEKEEEESAQVCVSFDGRSSEPLPQLSAAAEKS
jgi:hypothetical protein